MNNNQIAPPQPAEGGPQPAEGGPQISGKWFNPHSGDVVNVRDSLIDGDNMFIITDKGRMSMDEFQSYVQVEGDDILPNGPIVNIPTVDVKSQLMAGMNADGLLVDKDIFVDNTIDNTIDNNTIDNTQILNNVIETQPTSVATVTIPEHDKSYNMIDKIFTKSNIVPTIKLVIEDNTFPYAELGMLMEYFDVTADDIAEYVKDKFITGDAVKESIGNYKE